MGSARRHTAGTLLTAALAFAAASARAEDDAALKFYGSLRGRYEAVEGQARAGLPGGDDLVTFRTILGAQYTAGPVKLVGELWDSRAYGDHPGSGISPNEVDAAEIVQAYALIDLRGPLGPGSKGALQVGRMMLNIASKRLVAADDYRNTTNGYTGVKLDLLDKAGTGLTAFYVLPQQRRPDDQPGLLKNQVALDHEGFDLRLWGGFASTPIALHSRAELGFVGLDERDAPGRPTRDRRLRTLTARLWRDPAPGRLDYEVEAMSQTGRVSASTAPTARTLGVAANFIHLGAGYSFAAPWRPRLSVSYDRASGDHGGGLYNHFDTLFGLRRGEYGPSGLYGQASRANIASPEVRLELAPGPRLDGFIAVRDLRLASATDSFASTGVRDASGRSGKDAGQQLEARLRYWVVPAALRFEADGAWLAKGRFLTEAPNANPAHGDTRFLSLNMTATF